MATNQVTYLDDPSAVTARNGEYTDTPCSDVDGDGTRNSYLGCNRAGSNAPGIGINTAQITLTAAEDAAGEQRFETWTELDQEGNARIPQVSAPIGNTGFVDRSGGWDELSGGSEGTATETVRHIVQPASAPGTVDTNDTANMVTADTAAADGAIADTVSGALNETGATIAIGDVLWGRVPVA
jgi:hypothetical protein